MFEIPLGKLGEPEDVTGTIIFLASEVPRTITDHILLVDDGWTVQ